MKTLNLEDLEARASAAAEAAPGEWVIEDPLDGQLSIVQAGKETYEWRFIAHCPLPDEDEHEAFTGGEAARLAAHIATFAPPTALALLALARAGAASVWRPIAEAPKDGTRVIAACFGRYSRLEAAWWQPEFDAWITGCRQMVLADGLTFEGGATSRLHSPDVIEPTHWLPMPKAPEEPR